MGSEEDLFSEFYYPDAIVTENEVIVEVLSISRALPISSHIIKNLITLFARALLLRAETSDLWTSPRGSVHKACARGY